MGSVLAFVLRELDPPLSRQGAKEGGSWIIVWGRKPQTTCKKQMTDDRSTDRRHRREPDAPDPTDAGSHTHLATATPEACLPTRHSPSDLRHPRTVVDRPGPKYKYISLMCCCRACPRTQRPE
eukprot:scaffold13454_cov114-Isochrysis_galbana.AAC.4